ncbi:MAG TPA: DUF4214 domain-containing protein, partial [Pyrinomonadaceae bacterium]|nr:DUF4214 domain-containing protein [Pyrinomonadaceae bacterium]
DGTADQYLIFTGTIANVNAALSGMQFKPNSNYTGAASLKIISNDLGNAPGPAQLTDTDTITINVTAALAAVPSTFSLGAPTYTASEGALRAKVTVTREGDTSAPASVTYKTADPSAGLAGCGAVTGHASNRCDYATAVGTLRFAAGETSREISVPLVNDAYSEGPESFTLSLSKPAGAKLAGTTSAVVTINDDEADGAAAANPISSDEFFVRQLYIDVLGREADEKGLAGWVAVLRKCGGSADCGRAAVASAFFQSEEFKLKGYFAYRLYSAALGRGARYDEMAPDVARLSSSRDAAELQLDKADLVADFMARAEFKDRYGSRTTPSDYVDALLLASGLPNHTQRKAWVRGLADGSLSRGDVLWQLAESEDVSAKFAGEAETVMQYHVFFKREADAGVANSLALPSQKPDLLKLVSGFLNSEEYRQRFGR